MVGSSGIFDVVETGVWMVWCRVGVDVLSAFVDGVLVEATTEV